MPAPRLTPAQKTFGIGLLPAFEFFRPPEGMEFDPAYSNFTRQQQGLAAESQLQRQAFQQQRDELRRNQEVLAAEDDAIAAMKERPDEIPNILRSFPELARSRNLGGVLNYAQAVTPTAGQKTLAPSLRMKLDPSELRHFDEAFNQTGDALSAYDQARLKGENERGFAEMLGKGVPLEVAMQHKDKILTPFERAALVQQHAAKRGVKDEFREQKLKGLLATLADQVPSMNSDTKVGPIVTLEDVLKKQAENYDLAHRMVYPEKYQQPPAIATPAAEGGNVAPAVTPAPTAPVIPIEQQIDLSKVPFSEIESTVKKTAEKAKEAEAINKAWYDAQTELQKKLAKEFPGNFPGTNYSKLRRFAEAVVKGERQPYRLDNSDEESMIPVGWVALNKLGLNPGKNAFAEPGNRRVGPQEVPYDQVLQSWANNYLGIAPVTAQPSLPPISQETAKKKTNLLNSVGIGVNG